MKECLKNKFVSKASLSVLLLSISQFSLAEISIDTTMSEKSKSVVEYSTQVCDKDSSECTVPGVYTTEDCEDVNGCEVKGPYTNETSVDVPEGLHSWKPCIGSEGEACMPVDLSTTAYADLNIDVMLSPYKLGQSPYIDGDVSMQKVVIYSNVTCLDEDSCKVDGIYEYKNFLLEAADDSMSDQYKLLKAYLNANPNAIVRSNDLRNFMDELVGDKKFILSEQQKLSSILIATIFDQDSRLAKINHLESEDFKEVVRKLNGIIIYLHLENAQ